MLAHFINRRIFCVDADGSAEIFVELVLVDLWTILSNAAPGYVSVDRDTGVETVLN